MELHAIIAIISGVTTIGSTLFVLIRFIAKPIHELSLLYKELNVKREQDEKDIVRIQADLVNRVIICDERHSWDHTTDRRKRNILDNS